MDRAVQRAVQHRFRGRTIMLPRTKMHYPHNMERECARIAGAYMLLLKRALTEHLPALYCIMARESMRHDSYDEQDKLPRSTRSISEAILDMLMRVQHDFESYAITFNLEGKLRRIATQASAWSVSQWRRIVHETLGIDILEDYYKGEFFRHILAQWVNRNVGLIKSVPQETLTEMRNIIQEGWRQGALNRDIAERLEGIYKIKKSKAEFWARDQLAKLNGELARQQQQDAGVEEYIWSTSGDERVRGNPNGKWPNVRHSHYAINGKRCSWIDSTIYYNKGKWMSRPPNWVQKHPEMDYRCRCVPLPVFNLLGLSLPWEGGG